MSVKDTKKKKVAFKIRISKQNDLLRKKAEPQMITEWNYSRIVIVLVILCSLIAVGISLLWNKQQPVLAEKNKQIKQLQTNASSSPIKITDSSGLKEKKPVVVTSLTNTKQATTKTADQITGSVVRAQLANGIWKNEPFAKITGTIKVNSEEATGIYYFTELKNLKGKAIFHIWKYKGDVIFKIQKDVQKDPWKTYSSKLFTKRSIGPWSVETVDSNNRQLNLINFEVVAATD